LGIYAAAFFCVVGVLTGVFALLIALFGIEFGFLKYLFLQAIGIKKGHGRLILLTHLN